MTEITARLHFHCPFSHAIGYLEDGLTNVSETGQHRLQLTARVPGTEIELSKNVLIECKPEPGRKDVWQIHWTPEPGGIYPSFDGILSAHVHDADATTVLELKGRYLPPLGAVGRAFDHVIGRKLTADTAYDFLAEIAAEVRTRYAREEATEAVEKARLSEKAD
jgi:hypothetical protein